MTDRKTQLESNRRWSDCHACRDYYDENREALIFATASVGIEHGLTSNQALSLYMRQHHILEHAYE